MATWDSGPRPVSRQRDHLAPLLAEFERLWLSDVADDEGQLPSVLCRAAARALGVDGAGLCVQVGADLRLPLGASDVLSAAAERLQFTTGEGPCFEAMAQGRPISLDGATMAHRWPVLAALYHGATPFQTGLAMPLRAGSERFGVLDLYSRRPQRMDGHDIVAAQLVAQVIADVLLDILSSDASDTEAARDPGAPWMDSVSVRSRRDVWVAIGMINLELGLPHGDALAMLRAAAVARSLDVDHFAGDVVDGHIDLDRLL